MNNRARSESLSTFALLATIVSTIALSWNWAGATLQPVIAQGLAFLIATIALQVFSHLAI